MVSLKSLIFSFLLVQSCFSYSNIFPKQSLKLTKGGLWPIYHHGPPLPLGRTDADLESISKTLRKLDDSLSLCGPNSVGIRELTIERVQGYFRLGLLSSEALTKCYLERIRKIDAPFLKSVIEVNPDAVAIAVKADKERKYGYVLGDVHNPLHGIPILIKDNIGTRDGMQTTVGAVALEGIIPKHDADVVRRLRLAGAVILGKTNPSEWAYFRSTDIPSGWSGRGGQTLSPYNLTASPSGSSSGSGVAMSANLAVVALGSETDGSILSPSSAGSLVGLKPTLALVSMSGVIPLSSSQDVVGPMTRTVRDAAFLMDVISTTRPKPENYLCALNSCDEKKSWTIGILRNYWDTSNDTFLAATVPLLEASLTALRNGGFKIIDPIPTNATARLENVTSDNELTVFLHEFKHGVNKYLLHDVIHKEDRLGRSIESLSDIIAFNNANPVPENYSQILLEAAQETDGINNQTYLRARKTNRRQAQKFIESVIREFDLDAIASPCATDNSEVFYSVGAIAGSPSITIPVGISAENQMPVGLCFSGKAHSDFLLLNLGKKVEEIFSKSGLFGRRLPTFI